MWLRCFFVGATCFVLCHAAALNTMASLKYSDVPIQEKDLHTPPLEELVEVLSAGLPKTFESVDVSVVDCPDLTKPPFHLTSPGISGASKLVEVGGVPFLMPLVNRDKVYDLAEMIKYFNRDPGFLIGAGAGPWPYVGVNCEGMVNLSVRNKTVDQGTRVASVEPIGARKGQSGYLLQRLPNTETRSALLGNYLLSSGNTGKVIKVVVKKRIGESNFITAIREILKEHYKDNIVGLGGTFLLRKGRAKFHVMPAFSTTPLCSDSDVDNWLHYFDMKAPLNIVGTLISGDPGLDLRVQHFHGWGEHGDGGHYHYDTTPDTVEYEGYFAVAESIVRVDAPVETHTVGRD